MYSAKFGVRVKKYGNSVGTPAMREPLGAISQHDYQFGSLSGTADATAGDSVGMARGACGIGGTTSGELTRTSSNTSPIRTSSNGY